MAFVSVAEIARVFHRTERHIQQLVREGMPKERHGQYDLGRCMQWYIQWLQHKVAQHQGEENPGDKDALHGERERARLTKAQADSAEIDLAIKRGELLTLSSFAERMAYMISTARQQLLQMPGRIAPQLVGEDGPTIKQRLTLAVHAALAALAERSNGNHASTPRSPDGSALGDVRTAADSQGERVGGEEPDTPEGQPATGAVDHGELSARDS